MVVSIFWLLKRKLIKEFKMLSSAIALTLVGIIYLTIKEKKKNKKSCYFLSKIIYKYFYEQDLKTKKQNEENIKDEIKQSSIIRLVIRLNQQ